MHPSESRALARGTPIAVALTVRHLLILLAACGSPGPGSGERLGMLYAAGTALAADSPAVYALALDGVISRYTIGGGVTWLPAGVPYLNASAFAASGGQFFLISSPPAGTDGGGIYVSLGSGGVATLAVSDPRVGSVLADAGHVYWTST